MTKKALINQYDSMIVEEFVRAFPGLVDVPPTRRRRVGKPESYLYMRTAQIPAQFENKLPSTSENKLKPDLELNF